MKHNDLDQKGSGPVSEQEQAKEEDVPLSTGADEETTARPAWYGRAAEGPLASGGMTPELAARIQRAAETRPPARRRRALAAAGAASALLLLAAALAQLAGGAGGGRAEPAAIAPPGGGLTAAATATPAAPPPGRTAGVAGQTPATGKPSGSPDRLPATSAASASQDGPPSSAPAGTPAIPAAARFELASGTYVVEVADEKLKPFAHAAETSEGILWSPAPPIVDSGTLDEHSKTPYSLYLSPPGESMLSADHTNTRKIYELPLTVYNERAESEADMRLDGLYGIGPYAMLVTSAHLRGAAQPSEEKLWALDLRKAKEDGGAEPREIVSFHSVGGYMFSMAIDYDRHNIVYVSGVPDGNGGLERTAIVYHLATGEQEEPIAYESRENGTLSYTTTAGTFAADMIWP